MKHLYQGFVSDLGGADYATVAQLELARRAAGLAMMARERERQIVAGDTSEEVFSEYVILSKTLNAMVKTLGTQRVTKPIGDDKPKTLEAYLNTKDNSHSIKEASEHTVEDMVVVDDETFEGDEDMNSVEEEESVGDKSMGSNEDMKSSGDVDIKG